MTIRSDDLEITQKKVKFYLNDNEFVIVSLTKSFIPWNLGIVEGRKELTIQELIEICNLIYSENIIEYGESIRISFENDMYAYISEPNQVISEILNTVKVTISEEKIIS